MSAQRIEASCAALLSDLHQIASEPTANDLGFNPPSHVRVFLSDHEQRIRDICALAVKHSRAALTTEKTDG